MMCPRAARRHLVRRPTWQMTAEQLARAWANVHGVHAHVDGGGWLYWPNDKPFAQGWAALATRLQREGIIRVGRGIDWSRDHYNYL